MRVDREPKQRETGLAVDCPNCGQYSLTGTAETLLGGSTYTPAMRAKLAYGIRRRGGGTVSSDLMNRIIEETELPLASVLLDNLLVHVANISPGPGEQVDLWAQRVRAPVGALSSQAAWWAIDQAQVHGLLNGREATPMGGADEYQLLTASLTLAGWQRVNELLESGHGSRKAFMAMKFGDSSVDDVFLTRFKPAVKATGFDLVRLDESPRAGLIDDRLRLEIRTSRFLIADLTHSNNGAYWEAGYAEGLGRPVIYTCRKDVFDDPATRPHFDTNHYLTVVWDPSNLDACVQQLKAVIRVTLPSEATLTDA
jgi:hypothetical protein